MADTTNTRDVELERIVAQRDNLKYRHTTALAKLMDERADLRGAYAFADFVEEAVRWSA